jgi:diaminopropionate ammonia-lyase
MSRLAAGTVADVPLIVGESGAAGYAGVEVAMNDPQLAHVLGLNSESRVLVISTEGATAPAVYHECVGETAGSVLSRQAQWLAATVQ